MPLPHKTAAYLENRARYVHEKKNGWALLATKEFKPWEKNVVGKAVKVVLNYSVEGRKWAETSESMNHLIPIIASEITATHIKDIPEPKRMAFSKLMLWVSENHNYFAVESDKIPPQIIQLAQAAGKETLLRAKSEIVQSARNAFNVTNLERPENQTHEFNFRHNFEFRLKHDVFYSLAELRNLMNKCIDQSFAKS